SMDGVTRFGKVEFNVRDVEFVIVGNGSLDHIVPIKFMKQSLGRLKRVLRGHHEPHLVEVGRFNHDVGDNEMSDVDGIERSKEQAYPGSLIHGYWAGMSFFLNSSYNRCASASDVSRFSLRRTTSNWSLNVVSNFALKRRRERLSSVSVPRSLSRSLSTSSEGTLTNTASARSPK